MYSIVEIKGRQYKVTPDSVVRVDRIDLPEKSAFTDVKVLLHNKDGQVQIGKPYLDAIKVKATVTGETRGEKVISIRYKPKSGYTKTHGHRQNYTLLKIESIT